MFDKLVSWLAKRRSRKLAELLVVEWDDVSIKVRVLDELDPQWNQDFGWAEIVRVCFKDEGIYSSDILFLETRRRPQPFMVPTEALRGPEFCAELTIRGLFPESIARQAITSTNGKLYCWPPKD